MPEITSLTGVPEQIDLWRNMEKHYTLDEQEVVNNMRSGIVAWYLFPKESRILYIGQSTDPVYSLLKRLLIRGHISELDITDMYHMADYRDQSYDYVICIGRLESAVDPSAVLTQVNRCLTPQGKLLLGMHNRMGIRYFCGDRDDYSGRSFDGIENYQRFYAKKEDPFVGRSYNQAEIRELLHDSGWKDTEIKFWSVFPGLDNPQFLFAEGYMPNEDLVNRIHPEYNYPDSIFLEEEQLYASLLNNGMFHKMANAYLVECSGDQLSEELEISNSLSRKPKHSFCTILYETHVIKRCLSSEGRESLRTLKRNMDILASGNIPVVSGDYRELNSDMAEYVMPYENMQVTRGVMNSLAAHDKGACLQLFDHFMNLIAQTSELVELPDDEVQKKLDLLRGYGVGKYDLKGMEKMIRSGPALKDCFFDLVPINTFYQNGEFIAFDQEFLLHNVPYKVMQWRVLNSCYAHNQILNKYIPLAEMTDRYGLKEYARYTEQYEIAYLHYLQNEKELLQYHRAHRPDANVMNANRQRMNYSEEEYNTMFVDIFRHADSRALILFGSGNFARSFLDIYGSDYKVVKILDNNSDRWNTKLKGIDIVSPDYLKEQAPGTFKVIVCIKNYVSVIGELRDMGIYDFGIYDPSRCYPRREVISREHQGESAGEENADGRQKAKRKYHVGYIAGVFDLIHIGHLNMFRRAKELCDYLIVGVVTDEGVRNGKHTEPFIPFEERIEMVRGCRYVDEAIRIPEFMADTDTAWRTLHFDVQFSGSDYEHDPVWLAKREFLRQRGADLVFFPYTKQTSSTKIKALINHRLEDDRNSH